MIPYILWNTLYYIFFVSITRIPFLYRFMNSEQLPFGVREYIDYVWHGYYTLWFLRTLIWMIICAPIIYLLLKRRKYYLPEVALIILIILKVKGINILFFDIYYIMGAYLGLNCTNLLNKNNKKIASAAFICFLGVLALGDIWFGNLIYTSLFIATSWLALDLFTLSKDAKWWMKCTFFFYCAHDMVLESVEKIILMVLGREGSLAALIDYIAAPILTLGVLIGIAWCLKNYIPPVWKVLNGGR